MTADLFANQELPPVVAPGDFPLSPRTEGNTGAAPITIRFPEHVKLASVPRRHTPPCCQCGEKWPPFGFKEFGEGARYFGACRKHRDEVQEIVRGARL